MTGLKKILNILLVEDDEDDYILIHSLLVENFGENCQLNWVFTIDDAAREICSQQYDLILLDYRINSTSGLEFIKFSRQQCPSAVIVMITGWEFPGVKEEAFRLGARGFIDKNNMTGEDLVKTIQQVLV